MKLLILVFTLIVSSHIFAAGGTGASSLIPSFVNVAILSILIVYLLKDKAKLFFSSKSETISEMINRAESKAKEAEMMMAAQKEKTAGLNNQIETLKKEQVNILNKFESSYSVETEHRISKLKEDAEQKIEAEKSELLNQLNANLLDLVVSNAKAQLQADPSLAKSAASNIVKGL